MVKVDAQELKWLSWQKRVQERKKYDAELYIHGISDKVSQNLGSPGSCFPKRFSNLTEL